MKNLQNGHPYISENVYFNREDEEKEAERRKIKNLKGKKGESLVEEFEKRRKMKMFFNTLNGVHKHGGGEGEGE